MTTLKALDGKVQMISEKGQLFYSEAQRFVEELKKYSTASSHYTVISIIGPQSSGKSHMLNTLFGTKFDVLNAAGGRRLTTRGIWIAKCVNPCMIIMDVEGMDGSERGEDDTLFERQSSLFSLTLSDVLLLNMWFHDIGRVQGANLGLMKLIFEQRVKIEAPKTTIIILVRDYDYQTPPDIINEQLKNELDKLWKKVHSATTDRKMSDYIKVIVKDIPHIIQMQEFSKKSKDLAEFLRSFAANESQEQKHGALGFAHSSKLIWDLDLVCRNKRLSVTDHKLAMSTHLCNEIKKDIFSSFNQEKEYSSLMSGTSITSVKEFNTKLLLFLKKILARYEEECRAFDRSIRKEVRDKLEEETLQIFRPTFEDKLLSLSNEILTSVKSELRGQLHKLPVLDQQSVIGVLRPYLKNFDYNSCEDVHPYFQEVLDKHREQLVEDLTKIGEKKGTKILSAKGATKVCVMLSIGTAWALCTGDTSGGPIGIIGDAAQAIFTDS